MEGELEDNQEEVEHEQEEEEAVVVEEEEEVEDLFYSFMPFQCHSDASLACWALFSIHPI